MTKPKHVIMPKMNSDLCDCCDSLLGDSFELVTNAICAKCMESARSEVATERQLAAMIVDMTESLKEKSITGFAMSVRSLAIAELTRVGQPTQRVRKKKGG